jgi:hypothetical protein
MGVSQAVRKGKIREKLDEKGSEQGCRKKHRSPFPWIFQTFG